MLNDQYAAGVWSSFELFTAMPTVPFLKVLCFMINLYVIMDRMWL